MKRQKTTVKRIDTNGNEAGSSVANFEVNNGQVFSVLYEHSSLGLTEYFGTGKVGVNVATGKDSFEMASESDERIWVLADLTSVDED